MTRDDALREMQLPHDATDAAIKRRYYEMALKAHPDRGGSPEAFAKVTRLYHAARGLPITQGQARQYVRQDTIIDVLAIGADIAEALDKKELASRIRGFLAKLPKKPLA